jgi:hypothetical protein
MQEESCAHSEMQESCAAHFEMQNCVTPEAKNKVVRKRDRESSQGCDSGEKVQKVQANKLVGSFDSQENMQKEQGAVLESGKKGDDNDDVDELDHLKKDLDNTAVDSIDDELDPPKDLDNTALDSMYDDEDTREEETQDSQYPANGYPLSWRPGGEVYEQIMKGARESRFRNCTEVNAELWAKNIAEFGAPLKRHQSWP